jgi:predicted nucleotidyltransferase component of viral defense system
MTRDPHKNSAASVRARLLTLAQNKGDDYQRVLGRYAIERFLFRLGRSRFRETFAIKGATLFTLWMGQTPRPTKDLDLLGWGSSAIGDVETTVRGICDIPGDDGILFDAKSVEGERIKEDDEYEGVRVTFRAGLAGATIPMQVDIGFGDAVYPEPQFATFPVLLPMDAPLIRAYPREASVAEKFQAMVALDIRNSRMKDFYDIWFMANTWNFDMSSLRGAILASFDRRGVEIPQDVPFALTNEFLNDPQKKQQWNAFVSRLNPGDEPPSLEEIGAVLRAFLLPCILQSPISELNSREWSPSLHWTETNT